MALARVLKACAKESGSPIGVLCKVASELQWCMAPLLILSGNEIVEASLLKPIKGEHGTSPTPEEEATLLGDIKPKIKHKTEPPQVPEQLEIHEQVQPVEQTATPTASFLPPPSQPRHLPPQKAKEPQEKAIGVDVISVSHGSGLTLRRTIGCLSGGESFSFSPFSSTPVIPPSKNWPTNKPHPSGYPPHSWRMKDGGLPHPVWKC